MAAITIIGTGYVGLTTGACFARLGHKVICADIDSHKIKTLNRGEIFITENQLGSLVADGVADGLLTFTTGVGKSVKGCSAAFLCVPTPTSNDGSVDLSYIKMATAMIADTLPAGATVVTKSTVPVGTANMIRQWLNREDVDVVSNPEFLKEGSAVNDFMKPERIVIGSSNHEAATKVAELYTKLDAPIIVTTCETAEIIKYAANSFLAIKLSFINSIAAICEQTGASIVDTIRGIGSDSRIGSQFLQPGPGWGGSCFPKDTKALTVIAETAGYSFDLLKAAISANHQQIQRVVTKIVDAAGGSVDGKCVALLGLTFKANTNDCRESPALLIAEELALRGATFQVYDPTVTTESTREGYWLVCSTPQEACLNADIMVLATEWQEFAELDPAEIKRIMTTPTIVDARNLLNPAQWRQHGFRYEGIGQ